MVAPLPAPPTPMDQDLKATLSRIVEALDRLAPSAPPSADTNAAEAYVWHASGYRLEAVPKVNRVALDLLMGVDRQKETLLENTRRFAKGLPANNALLGMLNSVLTPTDPDPRQPKSQCKASHLYSQHDVVGDTEACIMGSYTIGNGSSTATVSVP